jgi:hypothetical protein
MDTALRIGCHREWLSGAARSIVPAISPPRDAQRSEARRCGAFRKTC